jgi:hypothetical protein
MSTMRHFVQYHNPDKMGAPYRFRGDFSVYTSKPYPLLAAVPGNTVWLIGGEGHPRHYFLCYVFLAEEIGTADHPSFRWYARGTIGRAYEPVLPLDGEPWFPGFLWRMANFSLGLRELAEADRASLVACAGAVDWGSEGSPRIDP